MVDKKQIKKIFPEFIVNEEIGFVPLNKNVKIPIYFCGECFLFWKNTCDLSGCDVNKEDECCDFFENGIKGE